MTHDETVINSVLGEFKLDTAVHACALSIKFQAYSLRQTDVLEKRVREWHAGNVDGWLMFTGEVKPLYGEEVPSFGGKYLLAAELAEGGKSLHVRQQGDGWVVTELVEGNGTDHLQTSQSFVSMEKTVGDKRRTLDYRVYWKANGEPLSEYRPVAFRFTGYGEEVAKDAK